MNQLNKFMKDNYSLKSFKHNAPSQVGPDLNTQSINGKRYYITPKGEKYPSITTVLSDRGKEGIRKWRAHVGHDVANQIMRSAARRGTAVHTLIENYLNNEELTKQEVLPLALFTIMKDELDNVDNIVLQEAALYSDKYQIAGRVDCIAEYDGKLSVIDFKTSTKEKKEEWCENYFIQCSAYCEMYEERFGNPIEQVVILMVTEDGAVQRFVKDKKDYLPLLKEAIADFTISNLG